MEQRGQPKTLRDIASTLFIHKWTIILCTVIVGGLAAILSFLQKEEWEATAQVWAHDQAVGVRNASDFAAESSARIKGVLTNLQQVMTSRSVIAQTLHDARLISNPDPSSLSDIKKLNSAITKFRKGVKLEAPKGNDFGQTPIFYLRVKEHEPQLARDLTEYLLHNFQARYDTLSSSQADHLVDETSRQLSEARSNLTMAERKLTELLAAVGPDKVQDLQALTSNSVGESGLQRRFSTAADRLMTLDSECAQNEALFDEIAKSVYQPGGEIVLPGAFIRENPAIAQAATSYILGKTEFAKIAAAYTPASGEYKIEFERLKFTEQAYRDEIKNALAGLQQEMKAKQTARNFMQSERDKFAAQIAQVSNRFVDYSAVQQEIQQLRRSTEDVERRHRDAINTQLSAAGNVVFSIVDQPRTGSSPVSPKRKLNMAIGILLGLFIGLGLAFLQQQYSHTIRSEADLNNISDESLVVFSIPKIKNPIEKVA